MGEEELGPLGGSPPVMLRGECISSLLCDLECRFLEMRGGDWESGGSPGMEKWPRATSSITIQVTLLGLTSRRYQQLGCLILLLLHLQFGRQVMRVSG